jgi:hypothetical protein
MFSLRVPVIATTMCPSSMARCHLTAVSRLMPERSSMQLLAHGSFFEAGLIGMRNYGNVPSGSDRQLTRGVLRYLPLPAPEGEAL